MTDLKNLQTVQLKYLKRMMEVPKSTPTVGIYLELGFLPISKEIHRRQLVFLHHILSLDADDPVQRVYHEQQKLPYESNWANEIAPLRQEYNILEEDEEIAALSYEQWKSLVKKAVTAKTLLELNETAGRGSKSHHLQKQTLQREPYIICLYPSEAKCIFRVRTRTVSCKANQKGSFKDLSCRLCESQAEETQQHLANCPAVRGGGEVVDLDMCDNLGFENDRVFVKTVCSRLKRADELLKDLTCGN
jgi:hypothetical protein